MAYLRYGPDSDWYVFWYSDRAEEEQEERTGRKAPKHEARRRSIVGRTDATMVDGEMVAARLTAARELGVEVVAPHTLIRRAVRVAVNAIVR